MKKALPRTRSARLKSADFNELRLEILRRDGWRCQFCGERKNLEVHHIQFRSHLGADCEANLVTLCASCHMSIHQRRGWGDVL